MGKTIKSSFQNQNQPNMNSALNSATVANMKTKRLLR